MAKCNDKSVQTLNNRGYNVVKLPRAGIEPMDILGKDSKAAEWLGPLSDVWSTTAPAPVPSTMPSLEISGQVANQEQSIVLDAGLINALATQPNCLGLVLFTRSKDCRLAVFSREQHGSPPKLVLSAE